jgi:rhodanese-related sulfurtransferase
MRYISATALAARLGEAGDNKPLLLDVREPHEFRFCRIEGSVNMPMGQVFLNSGELKTEQETVVICHHGIRSAQVANFLESHGFREVLNLEGGVAAWASEVDRSMPTY